MEGGAKIKGVGNLMQVSFQDKIILQAKAEQNMLVIQERRSERALAVRGEESAALWHRRFGHAGADALVDMKEKGLVQGLSVSTENLKELKGKKCSDCLIRKQTRKPFNSSERESSKPLELIHMDLCGPMQTKSKGGKRSFLTFTDDFSRCSAVMFLEQKNQAKKKIEAFVNEMENQLEAKVKAFRTDRGGEFLNREMAEFCQSRGIQHQKTNPYSSQENGVAERLNRALVERARALLSNSGLEKEFWAEAIHTVNHLRNRNVSRVHGRTLEVLTGKIPSVEHLRVFGLPCYVLVPSSRRKKLDPVSEKGVFLGYEPDSKGWRILKENGHVSRVSRKVTFLENLEDGLDELGGARDLSRVSPLDSPGAEATPTGEASTSDDPEPEGEEILMLPKPNEREFEDGDLPEMTENGKTADVSANDPMPNRAERKYGLREIRKPSNRYPEHEFDRAREAREEGTLQEPKTRGEALAGEDAELWQKAMDDEIASLLENETWSVETVPDGVKPEPVKWVFKIKRDENGNVERYKGRVVAKGFKQKHGVDFEEVFTPVSRHPTVRAFLAVAAIKDLEIEQLDVKTAFLNGELEEEIWVDQPEGYEEGGPEKKCRLKKALYGLKQAPRAWYLKLSEEMEKLGYEPSTADSALLVKREADGEMTYAAVWVDDSLVVGSKAAVKRTKKELARVFDVRDLGEAKYFLGMEISRNRVERTVKLTQKRVVRELLQEYGMTEAKGRATPMSVLETDA
jgi:transposase InsO family protein